MWVIYNASSGMELDSVESYADAKSLRKFYSGEYEFDVVDMRFEADR